MQIEGQVRLVGALPEERKIRGWRRRQVTSTRLDEALLDTGLERVSKMVHGAFAAPFPSQQWTSKRHCHAHGCHSGPVDVSPFSWASCKRVLMIPECLCLRISIERTRPDGSATHPQFPTFVVTRSQEEYAKNRILALAMLLVAPVDRVFAFTRKCIMGSAPFGAKTSLTKILFYQL